MLQASGRIRGPIGDEDYDFDDPVVARAHDALNEVFYAWFMHRKGLLNRCRWIRCELAVALRSGNDPGRAMALNDKASSTIAQANRLFIDTARHLLDMANEPIPRARIRTMRRDIDARQHGLCRSARADLRRAE